MAKEPIFQKASRLKTRLKSASGTISHEDLWDLGESHIELIHSNLMSRKEKLNGSKLFNSSKNKDSRELSAINFKLELIEEVVKVREERAEASLKRKELKEKREKLLSRINTLDEESVDNLSKEEALKKLEELDSSNS